MYPYGEAVVDACYKSVPADFEVEEVLGFEPTGEGEHLFIWVEKTGLSTPELITRIARDYDFNAAQISHSGLKDKHAVTRQWLSLHLPGKDSPIENIVGDGYHVLRQVRHLKKLRPGSHKANRFRLRLREVSELGDTTRQQIEAVSSGGFANYFGEQRFGRKQDNVMRALLELNKRKLSRSRRGLLLSSLRSHLFNQILLRRIELDSWALPLPGDVFMLRGSHSIFSDELDVDLLERYRQLDISSCGSLYGSGTNMLSAEPLVIEQELYVQHADIIACLERQRSQLQMRPLRAVVENLKYSYDAAAGLLELELSLPAGSYVTTLLAHFLQLRDGSQDRPRD
jgi:tRNA pseudouridine13 synthase